MHRMYTTYVLVFMFCVIAWLKIRSNTVQIFTIVLFDMWHMKFIREINYIVVKLQVMIFIPMFYDKQIVDCTCTLLYYLTEKKTRNTEVVDRKLLL